MRNDLYWKQRFQILEDSYNQDARAVFGRLEGEFRAAQRTIEDQIAHWYARFAKNNEITLADARKWLREGELAEFQWDVWEYIRRGKENAADGKWIKELENASARFHISRLQALELQTQNTLENLFGNYLQETDQLMKRTFLDGYYHSAFEIQRGFGVGWDIAGINEKQLYHRVMHTPWTVDGKTFSQRIWGETRPKLIQELHTQLTQNTILGRAPDASIHVIATKMKNSRHNAGRLVMTESAYFASEGQGEAFEELGVGDFAIVATLDDDTSEICQQMDGTVIPMSQYKAGVTAPPFHPWCRSVAVPHFPDNGGMRAARERDGKTYRVPASMTYRQWKQQQDTNNQSKG